MINKLNKSQEIKTLPSWLLIESKLLWICAWFEDYCATHPTDHFLIQRNLDLLWRTLASASKYKLGRTVYVVKFKHNYSCCAAMSQDWAFYDEVQRDDKK